MAHEGYAFDEERQRFVRLDAGDPEFAGAIRVQPGHVVDIADGGLLAGILASAVDLAQAEFGPLGQVELLASLQALHRAGDVMHLRWRSLAGFHRYGGMLEDAWKATGEWAFVHHLGEEHDPLAWADGLDPFDEEYARLGEEARER